MPWTVENIKELNLQHGMKLFEKVLEERLTKLKYLLISFNLIF